MPPRSVKMKRRILGFQRRVWWPKWTPASRSSRIETTGTDRPLSVWVGLLPAGPRWNRRAFGAGTATGLIRRVGCGKNRCMVAQALGAGALQGGFEVGRERRLRLNRLAAHRVRERQAGSVEELALEAELARPAVDRVSRHRQVDRRQVDADLVRPARLQPDVQQRVPR